MRQQKDNRFESDIVLRLRLIAQSYAICENSIAVLSNLRTDTSYMYFGKTSGAFGLEPTTACQQVDSIWEEELFSRIHPDDLQRRDREELAFYHAVASSHSDKAFAWHMEQTMRMRGRNGQYLPVSHRIFYFTGNGQRGISYALCLYNLTSKVLKYAIMRNSLTGEERRIDVEEKCLLTKQEITVLSMVREGLQSKAISQRLGISKHTVDRHRQNIIAKLHTANMAEACHKSKLLGIVE